MINCHRVPYAYACFMNTLLCLVHIHINCSRNTLHIHTICCRNTLLCIIHIHAICYWEYPTVHHTYLCNVPEEQTAIYRSYFCRTSYTYSCHAFPLQPAGHYTINNLIVSTHVNYCLLRLSTLSRNSVRGSYQQSPVHFQVLEILLGV